MARIPFSARVLPRTRARLRGLKLDVSGQVQALRPVSTPAPFHTHDLEATSVSRAVADAMMDGRFRHFGQTMGAAPEQVWMTALPSVRFAEWLHGFGWLRELAGGRDAAKHARARQLVDGWIEQYGRHHGFAWHPELIAERLHSWMEAWSPALNTDHMSEACAQRRRSVLRQARYLRANRKALTPGPSRIRAGVALALVGARLGADAGSRWREDGFALLGEELSTQVLPDGGHISRSPATTLDILGWLKTLDALLDARSLASPSTVSRAIDRMEPMMAFFSHTDGGLAGFHGSGEGDLGRISSIVGATPARPFAYAPQSKFHRLARGETVIIADAGGAPDYPHDIEAHLSPLAFEMSVGEGRLVVNCAWNPEQPLAWREPVRATSAHSTLTLGDRSAGRLAEDEAGVTRLLGAKPILRGPEPVRVSRKEAEQGVLLEGEHNGYSKPTGLVHARRLFLSESGDDLRGEDALDVPLGETPVFREPQPFAVRFHIHPDVEARLGTNGRHVRLLRRDDPTAQEWVFLCAIDPQTQSLDVEPSAYLGEGDRPQHCSQIVIRGRVEPGTRMALRWAIRARPAPAEDVSQYGGAS